MKLSRVQGVNYNSARSSLKKKAYVPRILESSELLIRCNSSDACQRFGAFDVRCLPISCFLVAHDGMILMCGIWIDQSIPREIIWLTQD